MSKTETERIPTFAADGRRLRNYSVESVERLSNLHLITVVRAGRKGAIVSAHFRSPGGASAIKRTAHLGQKYSYLARIGQSRLWQHQPLLQRTDRRQLEADTADDRAAAELYIRGIFRAVPLSCLQHQPGTSTHPGAKVVPIDSLRPAKKAGASPAFGERRAA